MSGKATVFGRGILLTIRSGRKTPIAEIPTPDLAVPYAAPKQVKTIAEVHPIAPKKGCGTLLAFVVFGIESKAFEWRLGFAGLRGGQGY